MNYKAIRRFLVVDTPPVASTDRLGQETSLKIECVGWGVIRMVPWHVMGIFGTSALAHIRCLEAGKKYEVHFGEGNEAEQRFVSDAPSDPTGG
jgi:hypothetical protein